jgi:hypothetical protein
LIADASPQILNRLLALYPVSALKEKWPKHKRKDKILDWVPANISLKEIKDFLDEYFSSCKQHIYLFTHKKDIDDLPGFRIQGGEKISDEKRGDKRYLLYLAEMIYHDDFTDPLREDKIAFLWPICLEFSKDNLILRFVTMEKDVSSYFDEPSKTSSRNPTEALIVAHLESVLGLTVLDINKGIKHLWEVDRFDGTLNRFTKAKSVRTETMKPGYGFKKDYADDYETLKLTPLGPAVFLMAEGNDYSFDRFTSDPTRGMLSFSTYTHHKGDTDRFVAEILRNN